MKQLQRKQYIPLTVLQQVEVLLETSVMSDVISSCFLNSASLSVVMSDVTPSFNVGGVDAYYQEREDHSNLDLDWD